jgi:hypothetical protein
MGPTSPVVEARWTWFRTLGVCSQIGREVPCGWAQRRLRERPLELERVKLDR